MGGPAPKFDPTRGFRGKSGPMKLPAEGRKGDTPEWPLPGKPSVREREAWRDLWSTPQAVAWEKLGWTRSVARYCRVMVEAEERGAPAMTRAECRQMEDRLGLSPKSMRMLLWEVVENEVDTKRQEQAATDVRRRIKAVG